MALFAASGAYLIFISSLRSALAISMIRSFLRPETLASGLSYCKALIKSAFKMLLCNYLTRMLRIYALKVEFDVVCIFIIDRFLYIIDFGYYFIRFFNYLNVRILLFDRLCYNLIGPSLFHYLAKFFEMIMYLNLMMSLDKLKNRPLNLSKVLNSYLFDKFL
jgi:hypothetical protein